ncbi:MAG: sensor domain-containing diguanylate cyclase [Nitrospirae bacterium]|nr:sensor domain-containing diguanylate cyclase [Nitrospirota bacterium]
MQRRRTESAFPMTGWARGRSWVWKHHARIVLAGLFVLSAAGSFQQGIPDAWRMGAWSGGFLWAAGSLTVRYLRQAATDRRFQVEILILPVLAVNVLTQLTGGLTSPLTLLYVILVLSAALLCDVSANGYTVAAIFVLEGANLLVGPRPGMDVGSRALIWAAGLSLIPLVVKAYLYAERREKETLEAAVLRFRTGALALRPLPDADRSSPMWALTPDERDKRNAPVHARFDRVVENLFWLFKGALRQAGHCILFLPTESEGRFRFHKFAGGDLQELRSQCVISDGAGVVGFAVKERRLYRIGRFNPDHGSLEYCTRTLPVRSVMINPLIQDGRVEGVLVVDSLEPEAFAEEEEQTFLRLSEQVLEAINNRREHQAVQNRAQELSTLVTVGESLGSKLDLDHRLETMADKIKEIIPYDHCFIFLVEPGERRAELKVVRGYADPGLIGQSITLHDGFLALVVKRRMPLIRINLHERERGRGVFPAASGIKLRPASFLGLPMVVHDHVIGVLAITSQRPHSFDEQHKEFLKMLCSQAAISIADAKLHDEVNRLATTDSLTGVANHRRFQERLNEELERQAREEGAFTLLMIDVDHFKRINDRFGHPSGDQVLKQVAAVLSKTVRKIDVVARYGGEEFAVILLKIGPKESYHLAERIRKSVEGLAPVINGEPQKVTISLGMAVYPDDAHDRQMLIERADRALYAAKHNGRNKVCLYSKIR